MKDSFWTDEDNSQEDDKFSNLYKLIALVIFIWLLSIFAFSYFYPNLEDRSLFGGSFNAISSLFSGLAFAGVIYAILLQRKELQLQRKELRETRKVLAKTATAQEASARQFERQSNNMKITAKLNAYNTLIVDANRKIDGLGKKHGGNYKTIRDKIIKERDSYIENVKNILNIKDGN
jgi:hypothetical protein